MSKISESLRNAVWLKYIGNEKGTSICSCCNLQPIDRGNYECGHIVSRNNNGDTKLYNLRPICGKCNKSMGTKDMEVFMDSCGYEKPENWKGCDNPKDSTESEDNENIKEEIQEPESEDNENIKEEIQEPEDEEEILTTKTKRKSRKKQYCNRFLGVELIPGSDGRCGPDDGPCCKDCNNLTVYTCEYVIRGVNKRICGKKASNYYADTWYCGTIYSGHYQSIINKIFGCVSLTQIRAICMNHNSPYDEREVSNYKIKKMEKEELLTVANFLDITKEHVEDFLTT